MPREAAHVALKSWMAVNAVSAGVASAAEEEEEEEKTLQTDPFGSVGFLLAGRGPRGPRSRG